VVDVACLVFGYTREGINYDGVGGLFDFGFSLLFRTSFLG
jgi:hypothetical protein